MIKINLALRKTATAVATETVSSASGWLARFKGAANDGSPTVSLRDLASILGSAGIAFLIFYQVGEMKGSDLATLQSEADGLMAEQARLKTETAKVATYEELRKQIEADEKLIRSKLDTIKQLMADRNTPARLLMGLSRSIPAEVWLRELKVEENSVQFHGSALGFNQVSDFMKILGESTFVKPAELKGTEEARFEGFEVKNFELVAERK